MYAHLNTQTANAGEVLAWTGTDYEWKVGDGGGNADISYTYPIVSSVPFKTFRRLCMSKILVLLVLLMLLAPTTLSLSVLL